MGPSWATKQGTKHTIPYGCQQDPSQVYSELPLTYEVAQIGMARARKIQAEKELNHLNELILVCAPSDAQQVILILINLIPILNELILVSAQQ